MNDQFTTMIQHSIAVLTNPGVATFELYEKEGNIIEAAAYVALAALLAGFLGWVVSGVPGLMRGVFFALVNFLIFTGLVYLIGKLQRGSGTFPEVAYTFALFVAPLQVIGALLMLINLLPVIGGLLGPFIVIALLGVQAAFAYLAIQSSMNIRNTSSAVITLVSALVGTLIAQGVLALTIPF